MKQLFRWIGIVAVGLAMTGAIASTCLADADLGISSSQRDQLKALASNTRDRTGREREALRGARTDMFQAYSSYTLDWHKVKAARDKIGNAQLSLLNIHLDNEVALRNILKADQFKTLRDMMKRRVRDREVMVVTPPEADILNRLPDKHMLDGIGVSADKQKLLDIGPEGEKAIKELGESSKQLLSLYANYTLDSAAARKLISTVHQQQVELLKQQHRRQRQIRQVLTQDQFQKLQQEIAKKLAERNDKRSPRDHGPREH